MSSPDLAHAAGAARARRRSRAGLAARAMPLIDLTSLERRRDAGRDRGAVRARRARTARRRSASMPRHVPLGPARCSPAAPCASPPSPTSRTAATTSRRAAEETAAAVAAGADEVDVVAPIAAMLDGDIGLVGELVEACRAAAGPGITLKLILETGVPARARPDHGRGPRRGDGRRRLPQDLDRQGRGRRHAGGGGGPAGGDAARPAAGSGFKAAGGIRTAADAAGYLHLADAIMGPDWASPAHLPLRRLLAARRSARAAAARRPGY